MNNTARRDQEVLFQPLELPCGAILQNRIVKSAMSDSLGDGRGNSTDAQARLYERWAEGGVAASIVGEVQGTSDYAEKPGNLVLRQDADHPGFEALARRGSANGTLLFLQLGHAGAMAHPPISNPKGPSAIDMTGLSCAALTLDEVQALPGEFARTAGIAQRLGFGGIQIHAAHGFLLSQFLSPLFNQRSDAYGGSIAARMRLLLDVVGVARALALDPALPNSWRAESAVDPEFPRFASPPEGGITAWYTMRLTQIGEDREAAEAPDLESAVRKYEERDQARVAMWTERFHGERASGAIA